MSGPVQSDVLNDGTVAAKFNIPTSRPANLGSKVRLSQDDLLTAFRQVLSGKKVTRLKDAKGKSLPVKITILESGTAQILIDGQGFGFSYVGLLAPRLKERSKYLEGYLKNNSLVQVYAGELRAMIKTELSNDEFLKMTETLLTSQEAFVQSVRAKANSNNVTTGDILPDQLRHWDNLIAPIDTSKTLADFVSHELASERAALFSKDPMLAFYATSISFCAPGLVPLEAFRKLPADTVLQILERAAQVPDHFGLCSAFEICADWYARDKRFEAVGARLLDRLLGNIEQLKERCTYFSAAFLMTHARLAQHEVLRQKPAFWRRIAAAANASLVVRACGFQEAESMHKFAVERFGKSFFLSAYLETANEARWKPEWLSANHLVADAFGRVNTAFVKLAEAKRPTEWQSRIAKAYQWIQDNNLEIHAHMPAIGESARRTTPPKMKDTAIFRKAYEEFCKEPSVDSLLMCGPGFFTVGVPTTMLKPCHELAAQLHKDSPRWDDSHTQFVLQLLSYVALQARDVPLADSIADFVVEKARDLKDGDPTIEMVARLIECANANTNRVVKMDALVRRLEAFAYLAPSSAMFDLHDTYKQLEVFDNDFPRKLAKATAAARLGQKAA